MALASPPLANRVLPAVAPPNAPPPPNYQPRDPGQFRGTAPTPTSYGNFVAPTPGTLSDAGKFRLDQGTAALQRSAAARGNLLSTTTAKNLIDYGQGNASQEYAADYNRALQTYDTNRDTNAQNFGQQHTSYGDSLAGFGANTSATLGYNNDAQAAAYGNYDRAADASVRDQNFRQAENDRNAAQQNLAQMGTADTYAAQVASVAAQNAAEQAQLRSPRPRERSGVYEQTYRTSPQGVPRSPGLARGLAAAGY